MGIEAIIYYLVLLDSIGSIVLSFFFSEWYKKNYKRWHKHFPKTKGWALWYFVLVLWIGWSLSRLGIINLF